MSDLERMRSRVLIDDTFERRRTETARIFTELENIQIVLDAVTAGSCALSREELGSFAQMLLGLNRALANALPAQRASLKRRIDLQWRFLYTLESVYLLQKPQQQ